MTLIWFVGVLFDRNSPDGFSQSPIMLTRRQTNLNGLPVVSFPVRVIDNLEVLALALFVLTILLRWVSHILKALQRKPNLKIRTLPQPTFACVFGMAAKQTNRRADHRPGRGPRNTLNPTRFTT